MRTLLITLVLAGALRANPAATLTGRVTDPAGAAMADVDVQAINVETGVRSATTTNEEGLFRIPSLAPGTYRVVLQRHGFKMIIKPGVELRVQDIVALNFEMQIGSIAESITVEEGAPLVQAESGMLGQVIDRKFMSELPTLDRNPYDFVALSAGAVESLSVPDRGVGVSINGQRVESASFLLDGAQNSFSGNGYIPTIAVPNDAVREYRVMTNGFSAEYGRSAGFIANLVTKSGTNEYHGSLYDYLRNSALSANSFEDNSRGLPRPAFNRHQAGGTIGGPILRDKAFFFVSLESMIVRSSDNRVFLTPTPELLAISAPPIQAIFKRYPVVGTPAPGIVTRSVIPFNSTVAVSIPAFANVYKAGPVNAGAGNPQDTYRSTGRVDYALGTRNALTARYAFEKVDQFALLRQPYTSELDAPVANLNQNAGVSLTHIWSSKLVTESRLSFVRPTNTSPETGNDGWFRVFTITGETAVLPKGHEFVAGWDTSYQAQQSVNWISGRHSVKAGYDLLRHVAIWDADSAGGGGIQTRFNNVQNFVNGVATLQVALDYVGNNAAPGRNLNAPLNPANERYHKGLNAHAWYLQDTWKPGRRITLTPGLRWEYFGPASSPDHARTDSLYLGAGANYWERFANAKLLPITEAPGSYRGVNHLRRLHNFAPRLGLAVDLTGDGKTVLRAGGGIFFEEANAPYIGTYQGLATFTNVILISSMLDHPYGFTARGTTSGTPTVMVDPDLRTPYAGTWNATVEREVAGAIVLSASYVGSTGSSLLDFSSLNRVGSAAPLGRPNARLLPQYGVLLLWQNLGHSSFHGMQIKAEGRELRGAGLRFGANYSWGHSIDNGSSENAETAGFGGQNFGFMLDPYRPRLDRGDSSFDQRQRLSTYFVWQPPALRAGPKPVRAVVNGWQTAGIVSVQTGQPFNVWDGGVPNRENATPRPRVTGVLPQTLGASRMIPDPSQPNRFLYLPANLIRNSAGQCLNGSPFGCYNSLSDPMDDVLPRSIFRRPGSSSQNVSLSRNLRVSERLRIVLRGEFYNLFNHAKLQVTDGFGLNAPFFDANTAAGAVARYAGVPRQVVVAARLEF